jgi:hypothetical protein
MGWRLVRTGRNRWVILTRRWAIKVPRPTSWRDFLFGLINNMNEAAWSRAGTGRCPVALAAPGGFAIVMPRLRILDEVGFEGMDVAAFNARHGLRAEAKPDSFGWHNGEIVAVDYGW